jgi:putative ABC transport system ATP-binding protein
MSGQNGDLQRHLPTDDALRVLELISASSHVSFDKILATRALGEAKRAIPGDDSQTWSRRLVEVGESLHLRIRSIETSLSEALMLARQGTPVATCIEGPEGELRWILIAEVRGRRVRVVASDEPKGDLWVRVRRLRKMLELPRKDSPCRWIVGQPAMACEPPGRSSGKDGKVEPIPPLARLIGLVRPEKRDLWVILIFSIVVGLLALATPVAVEALVNTVAFGRYLQPVIVLALILFVFLAFAAAMRALMTFVVEIVQRRLFIRVVEDLAYRLPRVRQQAWDNEYGPELANRFFDVVTVQKTMAALLLDGISIVLTTLIGMTVLAFYHPFLLAFDMVLLVLIAIIIFGLGRGAVKTAVKESKAKYAVGAWLEELTRHPTAFKLHAGTQFALDRADQLAINWLDTRRTHFRILMRQILSALELQSLAATVLLGLGGWLVILGELTLGQLVAAELIVMMIVGSFAKLGKHMESFYDLLASVDKLGRLFDLPIESHDKLFHLRDGEPAAVNIRGVSYKHGSHSAINDLKLQLDPGDSIAVVGTPGSGKSTLVDLL